MPRTEECVQYLEQLHDLQAVGFGMSVLTPLCLRFFFCKTEVKMLPTSRAVVWAKWVSTVADTVHAQ